MGQEFKPSSGVLTGPGAVQIDAEVKSDMAADGYADYLLYFDARPDLSPAYKMDWTEQSFRGRECKTAAESPSRRNRSTGGQRDPVSQFLDRQRDRRQEV